MSGRKGSSGHQNLIRMASKKLLNEIIGDNYLSIAFIRENPLDIKTSTEIQGEHFSSRKVADAELRMYADIACAVVYNQKAAAYWKQKPILPHLIEVAQKHLNEGNMTEYYKAIRSAYGAMIYVVECEVNPQSNLLRDGPRLTAYRLIKQQNNHLMLILAVFEGTKVDNPGMFDQIWEFPRKSALYRGKPQKKEPT